MAKCLRYLILFYLLISSFNPVWAEDDISFERYFLNSIKNEKVGHSFILQKKSKYKEQDVFLTHKHSEKKFKRYGLPVEVVHDYKFYEDSNNNPIAVEVYAQTGDKIVSYVVDFFSRKKILVTYKDSKLAKKKNITLSQDIYFPRGINELYAKQSEEAVLEYSVLDLENDFKVSEIKAVKQREKGKYNVYSDMLPSIKSECWRDETGHLLQEVSPSVSLVKVAVDKKLIFSGSQDIFQKNKILSKTKIDDVDNIKEITYKILLNNYDSSNIPKLDANQRIVQVKDGIAYLKVKKDNLSNKKFRYPPKTKGLEKFLVPTEVLDFQNPNIKSYVNSELSKRPKDAYKFVKNLESYVKKQIEPQPNKAEICNASKVMSSKKGDPTDKALLLVSLLRAAKIPSQLVLGAKYVNAPEACFAYHPWVMAYIGEWVCLDAAVDNENSGVSRIALSIPDADIDKKTLGENLFGEFLPRLGGMRISILDFSLLHLPSRLEKDLKTVDHYSESGLLDYVRNSGMNADEVGIKNDDYSNRALTRLKSIEAKKYLKKAISAYMHSDINDTISNLDKVFKYTSDNDDYLNIDYAGRLASLGLFSLSKQRLANISDHKVWSNKIESFYKMYLPKVAPSSDEEKNFAKILSQIEFAPKFIDLDEMKIELENKKYKKSDYVQYLLSRLYLAKGDKEKARSYISKALRINPVNFLYHTHKLNILSSSDDKSAAIKEIDWLLKQRDITSGNSYGLKLHRQYLVAKKCKSHHRQNINMAKFYLLSNQNSKAKKLLNKELRNTSSREKDDVYILLGQAFYNLKKDKEARTYFLMALNQNKKNPKALEGLGDLEFLDYKPDEALRYYQKAMKFNKKDSGLFLKVANCHRDMMNEKDALYFYFQSLRFAPNNYKAIYNIAQIKGKYGNEVSMSDIYKQILSINASYTPAWFGLVDIAIKEKNINNARKYLKPAFYIDNKNPETHYYSGLIEVMNENYSYARRDFKKALELGPYFIKAKFELDKLK